MFDYAKLTEEESTKYKYKLRGYYLYDLPDCYEGFRAHTTTAPATETPYAVVVNQRLTIRDGYEWNGANVIRDRDWNMRASCVHDALCQLLNEKEATWKSTDAQKNKADYRRSADREWFCIVQADKDTRTAKRTYSAIRGYAKGWYLGGVVGFFSSFVRKDPTFACGAEASTEDPAPETSE